MYIGYKCIHILSSVCFPRPAGPIKGDEQIVRALVKKIGRPQLGKNTSGVNILNPSSLFYCSHHFLRL